MNGSRISIVGKVFSASRRKLQASGQCSPKLWHRSARGTVVLLLCGSLLYFLLPKPPLLDGISFSREVFDRNANRLTVTLSADDKYRIHTPLRAISPALIAATLEHEDRYFLRHPGFNPISLARSTLRYISSGASRYGASTITMQLARLRFALHTKTVTGKLLQIFFALQLERHYSKEQILEAYLNLAPYGGNLEGVGAASLALFRKSPSELSRYEAIALSVIPQSPARRSPLRDRINPALQAAMARCGGKDAATFQVFRRGIPASVAPHFVRSILRQSDSLKVHTSLDGKLQRLLEDQVSGWLRDRSETGLQNAAVLLMDWRTSEILSHLGSADFNNPAIQGQVDGTRARRSPGSTLKPFVYALAMEQGVIHPNSILLDAPRSFAGYNPENSDREFVGPLRASEALARSRNIPAVELAQKLKAPSLYEFLQSADVGLPKSASTYGLSLPLGGAEVRMTDLVRLYAMLANGGMNHGQRVISVESAFLAQEMLRNVPPPAGHTVRAPVYWKTGTSHGYHDAWSVGICGPYVLAVWMGNFNGRGNPALTGRAAAAPLFFRILESLENRGHLQPVDHLPPVGSNLRQVELCTTSGQLPGSDCRQRMKGWFIPGVSPISTCTLHQVVFIDTESGLRLSGEDGSHSVRREVFEFWPADILKLFAKAGLPRRQPPPFAPDQNIDLQTSGVLKILSPRAGAVYTQSAKDGQWKEIALQVNANADSRRIYWFDGKRFLGATEPEKTIRWLPAAGVHHITAIDQDGRQGLAIIQVEVL